MLGIWLLSSGRISKEFLSGQVGMQAYRSTSVIALISALSTGCRGVKHTPGDAASRAYLVTAHDYAFAGIPERAPAGWLTFRMANAGIELHMFGIARVRDGHTLPETIDSLSNDREVPVDDWGGPNAVSPGDTATASLYFSPGQYLVVCVIESSDGKRHLQKGMRGAFEVVSAGDTTGVSGEDALVMLTDYHVALSGPPLATGTRRIRVHNAATQGHDLEILRMLPGHSADDALRWFEHPGKEAPTARAVGGTSRFTPVRKRSSPPRSPRVRICSYAGCRTRREYRTFAAG
jgi:hypothetical protein